jgi:Fe(3+) dicitrate transport protein
VVGVVRKLILFFLIINTAKAQVVLMGTVYDKQYNPLSEVEIRVQNQQTFTDSLGNYQLILATKGNLPLHAVKEGYRLYTKRINLDQDTFRYDLYLHLFERQLNEVRIEDTYSDQFRLNRLTQVNGVAIYAGKKSELIQLKNLPANLSTNNARQVFGRVSGLNIWENDGGGIQLGIGGRGLSPNRVSNFNTRQNGYDISADALGYPESYYTPATEALEQIEVVRGAAALQYGPQFGGFINFKFQQPSEKKFSYKGNQTIGSFNFLNTFHQFSGSTKRIDYFAFAQYKKGDGWRPNSQFEALNAHISMPIRLGKLKITPEFTYMNYLAKQAGGLTDALFAQNPRQSIRDRNWFQVDWKLAALLFEYKPTELWTVDVKTFGLLGARNAVGFLGNINRADPLTERDLLTDTFKNVGAEARVLHKYRFLSNKSVILLGSRTYQGKTFRAQGLGTAGDLPEFQYRKVGAPDQSDYVFPSFNQSFFAENIFQFSNQFSITPGMRYEYIKTQSEGYYNDIVLNLVGDTISNQQIFDDATNARQFVLMGIGTSWKPFSFVEQYANISQNYKSITFNDIRIINPNFRVDTNLQDEKGYSADLGLRGNIEDKFSFDFTLFTIYYNNRIGSVLASDSGSAQLYRYRTNIAASRTIGFEGFVEFNYASLFRLKNKWTHYVNLSLIDAKYIRAKDPSIDGNQVEMAPPIIARTGMNYQTLHWLFGAQYAYTFTHFSDATNAEQVANAIFGTVPSYAVADLFLGYGWKNIQCKVSLNNVFNTAYFTRRAEGYPGPGILRMGCKGFSKLN